MFFFILSLIFFIFIMNINDNKNHCINLKDNSVVITFGNNHYFEGKSNKCIMEGYGKLTYVDGSYHQGRFEDNKKNGYGILFFNNHQFYESLEGSYFSDIPHGPFVINFKNKNKFIFYYNYSKTNFTGTMYYPNNTFECGVYNPSERNSSLLSN